MIHSILLAAQATIPPTPSWSFSTALVMIVCNILGLLLARYTTKGGSTPPSPVPGLGIPQLIGGTCLGHILGAGAILGLSNVGVL